MTDSVNQTILNMIANLKPPVENENNFEFSTPLKRSLSSGSNESISDSSQVSSRTSRSSFGSSHISKRPKLERKFDLSYVGSPREMRRLRADLVEARNTIIALEARIESLHDVRKNLQMVFEDESKTLKKQREYDRKTIEELENQLQCVRKREADLKQELVNMRSKCDNIKIKADETIEVLEKSLSDIKSESKFNNTQENCEISDLKRKILELEDLLQAAEENAETQKKLASELEKQLSEKNAVERNIEMKEMALQKAKLKIKELEYEKENYIEFQEQGKTQAHKLARYPELEKENERLMEENFRLKEDSKNKLLLEEEVHNLKTRLVTFKENEKKLASLQMQLVQAEMYLEEWRSIAKSICETSTSDLSTPRILRSTVERLQQQEITLTSEKVELESKLNTALHESKVAKAELEKNQKLLSDLKNMSEQKQNLLHRMQKKLLLISRERDSYRMQLDSYEKDLTMTVNTTVGGTITSNIVNQLESQKQRIDNYERIIEGYKDMIAKLESDLQNAQPGLYQETAPFRAEQISRLQKEVEQLKAENEQLRERRDQLEVQLETFLVGQDSLLGGKVFHQERNPLLECITQREKHIEKLEDELEKLKKKLKSKEEGIEMSQLGDMTLSSKEIQALKEQNKKHEAQYEKLKEFMKTSMQEFRNVIYMLLGYKIDRTPNSLYKLTSVYAEHPEDQLCFQLNADGALNLLENEFSATLEDMVNLHLRHQKSIPVFLSAITMDLFNSKTMTTKSYEIE